MEANEFKKAALKAVEDQFGIFFSLNQWEEFERKFTAACRYLNSKHHEVLLQSFISGSLTERQSDVILDHLTIGETYFFRETEGLSIFKDDILPAFLKTQKEKTIQIWSSGCCTGEEPFTLAILLLETIPLIDQWKIRILATDINTFFLEKAKLGIFKKWSLRGIPDWALNKYFIVDKELYKIREEVMSMVEFQKLNLIDRTAFPSLIIPEKSIDFIFCRNVLMYFSKPVIEKIALRFEQCLSPEGWLITSPVEVPIQGLFSFEKVQIKNQYFFKHANSKEIHRIETTKELPVTSVSDKSSFEPKEALSLNYEFRIKLKNEEDNINRFLKDATKFFQQRAYKEAIVDLEKLLEINETHNEAQIMLVKAYANMGHTMKAKDVCKKYIRTINHHKLYYLLATLEEETGNLYEAESLLRQAIYINPKFLIAYFMMGNILQKQGQVKSSELYKENLAKLLSEFEPDCELEDFEGITAGNLIEMITKNKKWKS